VRPGYLPTLAQVVYAQDCEAAPLILVITAPDHESCSWLKIAGAVFGVPLRPVAVLLALKRARGLHFG
jgi:hypothetical protein